jgi:hypothetical protein
MIRLGAWTLAIVLVASAASAVADEAAWTKALADRTQRGKLHDAAQLVRGDSGRWNDAERWVHCPAPPKMAARFSLDDWAEPWAAKKFSPATDAENWLVLSTRQLNDHDRVWVERVERRGNRLTVVVSQAAWRGKYFKNFTGYHVLAVNVGRLEPGAYEATCILRPLVFSKFDGNGQPQEKVEERFRDNWPQDEQPADRKPAELSLTFSVAEQPR